MGESNRKRYVIYADGACVGNPGPGGWGVVIVEPPDERRELNGGPYPQTTNNRMEITAAIEGLRALPEAADVTLHTDSEYVVKTMTLGWKRNKNGDLWDELDREVARHRVRFQWVQGHAGDRWNERADRLAAAAARGRNVEPAPPATEQDSARELEASLEPGEAIKRCAGCGRMFVASSEDDRFCALVQCQLTARRER